MEGIDLHEIRIKESILIALTLFFMIALTAIAFADGVVKVDDSTVSVNKTVTLTLEDTQKSVKDYQAQITMLQKAIDNANAQIQAFNTAINALQQPFISVGIDPTKPADAQAQPVNP